jgi:hypothetical protein
MRDESDPQARGVAGGNGPQPCAAMGAVRRGCEQIICVCDQEPAARTEGND